MTRKFIRREFLRIATLTAGSLPTLSFKAHAYAASPSAATDALYEIFREPAMQYRPMVRWWWNGDRVTANEVVRELDVMKAAGIGGVEINPIRFPGEADPLDTEPLTWMSDEWIDVLKVAVSAARERGMTCDMIVGSGWPYGGEFLKREDQTQMMALGTRTLTGPAHVRIARPELLVDLSPKFVSPYHDSLKELFGLKLVRSELGAVTEAVSLDHLCTHDVIEFDVPAGAHVLYFLVRITGFMAVINGAPGATGPVLNHYNGAAVSRYLERLSTRLSAKIGPLREHFRAFFTDSIELEGANWCDDMLAEFSKRRGYDLGPWLPFVLFKVGEMGNAITEEYGAKFSSQLRVQVELVRYDFETTKHELFQERFVGTFAAWCTRNGVKSRMQAYGMDCDPITAGMMVDIPECETWIRSEKIEAPGAAGREVGRSYTMINKFVSSAAHLAGKQLISCEEMTNTDDPFHASLERIKVAGDQSILSGVTQTVLHGFNYSPPAAPFPGWVRYGTYFSERNTWWPFFKLWADYKARLSAVFQQCVMQAQVAILPPSADLAAHFGFQRDPFPKTVQPAYLHQLWEVIHQNGSGCDYLNEEIVMRSRIVDGHLCFADRAYHTILLPEVDSVHPETARQLALFVAGGGTIVFLERAPTRATGLVDNTARSASVRKTFTQMRQRYARRTPVVPVRQDDMTGWYRNLVQEHGLRSDVLISEPTEFISQLHYRSGSRDLYLFAHYGPQAAHTFRATFPATDRVAWLWNAETGERELYPSSNGALTITLGPSDTKLIVFEAAGRTDSARSFPESSGNVTVQILRGPWSVSLLHVDGKTQTKVLPELTDLSLDEALRGFAGTMVYRNHLHVASAEGRVTLDLGPVLHSVTQLEVNGKALGTRWYGDHSYDLSDAIHAGDNQIQITVTTTLGNYMKTLTSNATARAWTERTPFYPIGLTGAVRVLFASRT